MKKISSPALGQSQYEAKTKRLANGLQDAADKAGVKICLNQSASLFTIFFTDQKVDSYAAAMTSNTEQFKVFFQAMLNQGFYLPPSQFECWFVSQAHSDADIDKTIEAAQRAFEAVANM